MLSRASALVKYHQIAIHVQTLSSSTTQLIWSFLIPYASGTNLAGNKNKKKKTSFYLQIKHTTKYDIATRLGWDNFASLADLYLVNNITYWPHFPKPSSPSVIPLQGRRRLGRHSMRNHSETQWGTTLVKTYMLPRVSHLLQLISRHSLFPSYLVKDDTYNVIVKPI